MYIIITAALFQQYNVVNIIFARHDYQKEVDF